MKKPLPKLQTDDEAERFVAEADLTEYDLSVKAAAASAGIPCQRFIRQTLEAAVQRPRRET
jgi:predicted DNA binding CopG/RHH family protein